MKFTVVMASYLGSYAGAANRRPEKICRAIDSVINQTFPEWELQVIADGCQQTVNIVKGYTDARVHVTLIPKRPMWDGLPRNKGIELGKGDYIVYLDIDDCYGENHLKIINDNVNEFDWVYFNDYIYSGGEWIQRQCDIHKIGMNGTSNICHKRKLGVTWGHRGYAHDHYFNQKLLFFRNFSRIPAGEYFVCHIPASYDV